MQDVCQKRNTVENVLNTLTTANCKTRNGESDVYGRYTVYKGWNPGIVCKEIAPVP
jgi:hypothetical protein